MHRLERYTVLGVVTCGVTTPGLGDLQRDQSVDAPYRQAFSAANEGGAIHD